MNCFYKNRVTLSLLLAVVIAGKSLLFSQAPTKIEINPLNRAIIQFNGDIPEFTSLLSADKKHVTIRVPSNSKQGNALSKTSNGIIKQVDIKKVKDSILINITFAEPRGYNAYPLPYSNTLVVEAFRWNDLAKAEDLYRQGLLAYESRVLSEAQSFFEKAAALNHPNANFFSGLLAILEEEFKDAEAYLLKAENLNSTVPDLYAALSYLADMRNDSKKAESYKRKFRALTGISTIKEIPSTYFSQEAEQSDDEPSSLLDINEAADTLKQDSTNADTTVKAVTEIKYSNDSTPVLIGGDKKQESFLPEWMNSFTFYAVGIGLAFVLLLVSSYMKWRNNKLRYLKFKEKSKKQDAFRDKLSKAEKDVQKENDDNLAKYKPKNKAIQSQAANAYKNAENHGSQPGTAEPKAPAGPAEQTEKKPEPAKEKVRESLEQQLDKLADKLGQDTSGASLTKTAETGENDFEPDSKPAQAISPSFQLALHLHEEQEKLRNRSIENIDAKLIPEDRKKLSEFAKKMGIDKGSVSVKKELSSLESDKELINSLYKKFAAAKKDKPD